MLRKILALLALVLVSLFAGQLAWSGEWLGSAQVKVVQKKPVVNLQEVIADSRLVVDRKAFSVFMNQFADFTGVCAGKKLRVRSSTTARDWTSKALLHLTGDTPLLTKVTGIGVTGKRWLLTLRYAGKSSLGTPISGTIQIGALRTKMLALEMSCVSVDGGVVELKTGESVAFDSGFFPESVDVEVCVQRDPLSKPADVVVASNTLVLRFPTAPTGQVDLDAGINISRVSDKLSKWQSRAEPVKDATIARIAISSGEKRTILYGYSDRDLRISNESLAPHIDASAQETTIAISDVYVKSLLAERVSLDLFHWNERDQKFDQTTDWQIAEPPVGEQVVLLIHGWQSKGEVASILPHVTTWEPLLNWATGSTGGSAEWSKNASSFDFYSIRYDSMKSVFDNAVTIQNLLAQTFKGRPIVVLAHSMGGLISHAMFQKYHPTRANEYVGWGTGGGIKRLVTLGTPFHGSPMISIVGGHTVCGFIGPDEVLVDAADLFLKLDTFGARSLAWDGFDGRQYGEGNPELATLNAGLPASIPEYRTFAGVLSSSSHPVHYRAASKRMVACFPEHVGDGVVPRISAHFKGFAAGQPVTRTLEVPMASPGYNADLDHSQLWKGRYGESPDAVHFSAVLAELDLTPRPQYQWNIVPFEYDFAPLADAKERRWPFGLWCWAKDEYIGQAVDHAQIIPLDGNKRVENVEVEISLSQSGSGLARFFFCDQNSPSGAFLDVLEMQGVEGTSKKTIVLKSNYKYWFELDTIATSGELTTEVTFRFPTR